MWCGSAVVISAICDLRFAICDLRFAICDLRFAICDLRFAICDLRFAICDTPSAIPQFVQKQKRRGEFINRHFLQRRHWTDVADTFQPQIVLQNK